MYAKLEKIIQEFRGFQDEMQIETKQSNCTINVGNNLTKESPGRGADLSNSANEWHF